MLTKCPECDLPVSDKAYSCPHCGYPLQAASPPQSPTKRSTRRKRLPNGFGQITKISGRSLRRPYRAMITIGKTETGKPIQKLLKPQAYFETYNDAYTALLEYNKNPFDLLKNPTVKEVYEAWRESFLKKERADSTIRNYDSPWRYCESLCDLPIRQLRASHIKYCLEHGNGDKEVPISVKQNIKTMFNVILDYAVENEYTDKNYSRLFNLPEEISINIKKQRKHHVSFTDEEMKLLWNKQDDENVQSVLIQCYTGFRPQELCLLYLENIDLDKNIIVGGMKTEAGHSRTVPIHPAIKPFIEEKYKIAVECGSDRLLTGLFHNNKNKRIPYPYSTYVHRFNTVMTRCGITAEHKPHDPRKQFITMAKKYKMDEYAIKRIVGHKIDDITEAIYTDRSFDWLYEEICKIPTPDLLPHK